MIDRLGILIHKLDEDGQQLNSLLIDVLRELESEIDDLHSEVDDLKDKLEVQARQINNIDNRTTGLMKF